MVALINGRSPKTLQTLQTCGTFIEQLIQEIEKKEQQKKTIEKAKKYTAEIKKNIAKLEVKISDNQNKILEVKQMLSFPPGAWVQNGTKTPGQVIDLVIAGRIPEVHVLWWGSTVQVPERPWKLKLVQESDLEFIWNGNAVSPKLIRRLDGFECEDIKLIEAALNSSITCKETAGDEAVEEYQREIVYCRKRIKMLTVLSRELELEKLEATIAEGLEVFYKVGEALLQIRDRKLYKDLGYSNFRDYLEERWNMKKSQAYRLIDSAAVIENLSRSESVPNCGQNLLISDQEALNSSDELINKSLDDIQNTKSVPNWGQNNFPKSEAVTRELGKLPADKQVEAWEKAVKTSTNGQPTAAQTKAVVAQIKGSINPLPDNKKLVERFEVGQLVKLKISNFEGISENLKLANHSYGLITSFTESKCSLNINVLGHGSFIVSPQDILAVNSVQFCVDFTPKEFIALMSIYKSRNGIEDAIKRGVMN